MGIQVHAIKLIDKTLEKFTTPNDEVQIIDWGNSYIKPSTQEWIVDENNKNHKLSYSRAIPNFQIRRPKDHSSAWVSGDFFKSHKYKYNAIDLNGKEESFEIDLRQDITRYSIPGSDGYSMLEGVINFADIIIDCGTSEHVDSQYYNFKNVYNILKVGGHVVHCLPKKGYWGSHCKYKYEKDFFKQLGELCNYEIVELFEYEESEFRVDICCVFKKQQNSKYPTKNKFKKLPIYVEKGESFNDRSLYSYAYGGGGLNLGLIPCLTCKHKGGPRRGAASFIIQKNDEQIIPLLHQFDLIMENHQYTNSNPNTRVNFDEGFGMVSCPLPKCKSPIPISITIGEIPKMIEKIKRFSTNHPNSLSQVTVDKINKYYH